MVLHSSALADARLKSEGASQVVVGHPSRRAHEIGVMRIPPEKGPYGVDRAP
jgi:hypothetical protein